MMKKILIYFVLFIAVSITAIGQTPVKKKPTIMCVPDRTWCFEKGYKESFQDETRGVTKEYPDYRKALDYDPDFKDVLAQIGQMFNERGYTLHYLESEMNKVEQRKARNATAGAYRGKEVATNPYNDLMQQAKADILINVKWNIIKVGPSKSIKITLIAEDTYTGEMIASVTGTGQQKTTPEISILLQSAVLSVIEDLQNQMQLYFDDLFENGRKINLNIVAWDYINLEDEECNGKALYDLITEWMEDNTKNGVFTEDMANETEINYVETRIDFFIEERGKQRASDAKKFGKVFEKYLETNCSAFNISTKQSGLGEVTLYIGLKDE
jgi:hypothetical protein